MAEYPTKPVEDDLRTDDHEYNPTVEPQSSKAWINLLEESEKAFEDWNDHCDKIDSRFASLQRLSVMDRTKEFQMFWANIEVLKPSIYAKPPIPVVVPKFKDRRPVYQAASEVAERVANVAFDIADINGLMLLIRDDLTLASRGVAWCRYESKKESGGDYERVAVDFKNRRDFLHSISRNWREVTWVAAASYLTRSEARERFKEYSGDAYQEAEYEVDKEGQEVGGADARERAKFWEIWDKCTNRVLWVAKGCEDILDEADPHLNLSGFFPCPKPAYGTLQRGSLVPVPDVMQYRDQLDEVNLLTGRIHALSQSLECKGFYPSGGAEIADAVQAAIRTTTPGTVLVPIANWSAFGNTKEPIVWMPIDMIATTITALVGLRKQIIDDIYQIMGLSDIMRGATDPSETLGAQELKTQYGSTRIRDKQQEMVRLARDLVEIVLDIASEKFSEETIILMSQTQLPTKTMQQKAIKEIQSQMQDQQKAFDKMKQLPQVQQIQQQKPDQYQQVEQQASQALQQAQQSGQQSIKKITEKPTFDQVMTFLRDNRAKAFVLDIETDSTILQDEAKEKQQRTEFLGVLSTLLPQLAQMIQMEPGSAELAGELLKFATAPFRAGRSLDGSIDEMVEKMKQKADQPRPDDPYTAKAKSDEKIAQMKIQADNQKHQGDMQIKAAELAMKDSHEKMKIQQASNIEMIKMQSQRQNDEAKAQQTNLKTMADREAHQAEMVKSDADMQIARQKAELMQQQHVMKSEDMQAKQGERQAAQQFKQQHMQDQLTQKGMMGRP